MESRVSEFSLAPIALFAYKRPKELAEVVEALIQNYEAINSEIYLFCDGPRDSIDEVKVNEVRKVLDGIQGFKKVHKIYSINNQGLATSIINGVSSILERYPSVIVLEDDLVTTPNFLLYMNQCLREYENTKNIFSISGYTLPIEKPEYYKYDTYVFPRTGSWGWATWKDRWIMADWCVSDYREFKNSKNAKREFNLGGSDRVRMLRRQQNGEINSWAIRWCYSQYKAKSYTIYPTESKIKNIGFSKDSTNTNVYNRYKTFMDCGIKKIFNLPDVIKLDNYYVGKFRYKYSMPVRLYNRLKTYAGLRG
ncbi:glycosyltransferase [Spirosoma lituiforme]